MYDIEALYEAGSVSQAIALLQEHPGARIIAGGSDVLIRVREGRLAGCVLVSIQKLDAIRGISLDPDETIRIGALTCFSRIACNPVIQRRIPVLGEAADTVGGPQIRNIATIGGNICNGVSSADSASTLLAWDAVLEYSGPKGIRLVPIGNHFMGPGKTALNRDELLTAILIPKESYTDYYGHYIKYAMRNAMDIAVLGCSVNVRLSQDKKTFRDLRIAYGVAGPAPLRAPEAEGNARGRPVNWETAETLGKAVIKEISPRSSPRASREFRLHLAEELAKRALRQAVTKAGGTL
ncbi:MAG: xanthine dehydrogenase FAD-binding subunit XdhB [Treponema sp.]|jgi:xanthine dehydrogenase FAD-binding subunit|nr:xanthine dehydrogenase FAD-binding subunit XdhB [Treponema sp.]